MVGAVVVAAGSGQRFGQGAVPKQFQDLAGHPILWRALQPLLPGTGMHQTVVVLAADFVADPPAWLRGLDVQIVAGGETRSQSVRNGLGALSQDIETVLIHDGARPLLDRQLVGRILEAVDANHAVIPGVRVTDTLKSVDAQGSVTGTVDRDGLWGVQTPQAFPREMLVEAHRRAAEEGFEPTDDAGLFEHFGFPVRIVQGQSTNLKVTTPADIRLAEAYLAADLCNVQNRPGADVR